MSHHDSFLGYINQKKVAARGLHGDSGMQHVASAPELSLLGRNPAPARASPSALADFDIKANGKIVACLPEDGKNGDSGDGEVVRCNGSSAVKAEPSVLHAIKETVIELSGALYGGSALAAWAEDEKLNDIKLGGQSTCEEHISQIFNRPGSLAELVHIEEEMKHADNVTVYGPGALVQRCPWSTRTDGGIVSVDPETNQSGDYIYFIGIIDILQEYNAFKRVETLYKVRII
jgi:hypothetical protein